MFFLSQQEACMELFNRQTGVDTHARVQHNYLLHPDAIDRWHNYSTPALVKLQWAFSCFECFSMCACAVTSKVLR